MGATDAIDPHVDIGMPCYRRTSFITQAIESVLAQTFTNWRLTISENGRGGGEIEAAIDRYRSDPRIEYRPVGRDIGSQANHTRLLQLGQAPYVALIHDDDLWSPWFLERRVEFLESHRECAFAFGGYRIIDGSGDELGRFSFKEPQGVVDFRQLAPYLFRGRVPSPSNRVVRREAYDAVGATFDERFIAFDWEMWIRLSLRSPAGHLGGYDSSFRLHGDQLTYQVCDTGENMLSFYEHVEGLIRARFPGFAQGQRVRRRKRSSAHLTAALDKTEMGDRRKALAHLGRAISAYPPSLVDPRILATLTALPWGSRGGRLVSRMRSFVHLRRIRVHLFPHW